MTFEEKLMINGEEKKAEGIAIGEAKGKAEGFVEGFLGEFKEDMESGSEERNKAETGLRNAQTLI